MSGSESIQMSPSSSPTHMPLELVRTTSIKTEESPLPHSRTHASASLEMERASLIKGNNLQSSPRSMDIELRAQGDPDLTQPATANSNKRRLSMSPTRSSQPDDSPEQKKRKFNTSALASPAPVEPISAGHPQTHPPESSASYPSATLKGDTSPPSKVKGKGAESDPLEPERLQKEEVAQKDKVCSDVELRSPAMKHDTQILPPSPPPEGDIQFENSFEPGPEISEQYRPPLPPLGIESQSLETIPHAEPRARADTFPPPPPPESELQFDNPEPVTETHEQCRPPPPPPEMERQSLEVISNTKKRITQVLPPPPPPEGEMQLYHTFEYGPEISKQLFPPPPPSEREMQFGSPKQVPRIYEHHHPPPPPPEVEWESFAEAMPPPPPTDGEMLFESVSSGPEISEQYHPPPPPPEIESQSLEIITYVEPRTQAETLPPPPPSEREMQFDSSKQVPGKYEHHHSPSPPPEVELESLAEVMPPPPPTDGEMLFESVSSGPEISEQYHPPPPPPEIESQSLEIITYVEPRTQAETFPPPPPSEREMQFGSPKQVTEIYEHHHSPPPPPEVELESLAEALHPPPLPEGEMQFDGGFAAGPGAYGQLRRPPSPKMDLQYLELPPTSLHHSEIQSNNSLERESEPAVHYFYPKQHHLLMPLPELEMQPIEAMPILREKIHVHMSPPPVPPFDVEMNSDHTRELGPEMSVQYHSAAHDRYHSLHSEVEMRPLATIQKSEGRTHTQTQPPPPSPDSEMPFDHSPEPRPKMSVQYHSATQAQYHTHHSPPEVEMRPLERSLPAPADPLDMYIHMFETAPKRGSLHVLPSHAHVPAHLGPVKSLPQTTHHRDAQPVHLFTPKSKSRQSTARPPPSPSKKIVEKTSHPAWAFPPPPPPEHEPQGDDSGNIFSANPLLLSSTARPPPSPSKKIVEKTLHPAWAFPPPPPPEHEPQGDYSGNIFTANPLLLLGLGTSPSSPSPSSSSSHQHLGGDIDNSANDDMFYVGLSNSVQRKPRKKKRRNEGVQSRPADHLKLQRQIRRHTKTIMGRRTANEPLPPPPSEKEISAFLDGNGPGPSVNRFRWNYHQPPSSPWNQVAMSVFAQDFEQTKWHPKPNGEDEEEWLIRIEAAFKVHIIGIAKKYVRFVDKETRLSKKQLLKYYSSRSRRERKLKLYHRRLQACEESSALERHREMLIELTVDGMSSDESDKEDGVPIYKTRRPPWRAAMVSPWLRTMDAIYSSKRQGDITRENRGKVPHIRRDDGGFSHKSRPVAELPRNFYNAQWLSELPAKQRRNLRIKEQVYEMKHSVKS